MFGEMMRPRHDLAGLRVPIRGLGFTPTGDQLPSECSQYGVRMVEEQGGYTPIGCPIAGVADCHDIIDADTGTVIIAKTKGKMPWIQQCGQWGYANPGEAGECPAGQGMINGQCGEFAIACPNGDGTYILLEAIRDADGTVTGLTGRNFGSVPGEQVQLMPRVGARPPNEPWCKDQAPSSEQQEGQDAAPEPESTPSPEPSAPTTPAPIPTTPVTQLSPPQAGFQTPCNPGRPTQMGRARMSRDFFGRSMF